MKNFFYTYKITLLCGSLSGKYYYGQHSTLNLFDGYAGSGSILHKYYKKYGKIENKTYIKEIVGFYNSLEELNQAEYDLIGDKYLLKECLNCRAGGGKKGMSEETKEKLSKSHKGRKYNVSEEVRKAIGERNRKRAQDPEFKKKLSDAMKKKYREDKEYYENRVKKNREKTLNPEYIKHLSEGRKGKGLGKSPSKESIQKGLETRKRNGHWYPSEEQKEAIRERNRKKALDPEFRKKISKALKGKPKIYLKGKKMLNNGKDVVYVNPNEIQTYLDRGWKLGRIHR